MQEVTVNAGQPATLRLALMNDAMMPVEWDHWHDDGRSCVSVRVRRRGR
jgi:hypothetical protein